MDRSFTIAEALPCAVADSDSDKEYSSHVHQHSNAHILAQKQ